MTFPHSATIERKTKVGDKYTFDTLATSTCFVQPINAEESQLYGLVFSKSFRCYVPIDTDIKIGDRVIYGGETYGVRGVNTHDYVSSKSLRHKKAMLEKV